MCQNAVSVGKMHITQSYNDTSREKSKLLLLEQVVVQTQGGTGGKRVYFKGMKVLLKQCHYGQTQN